MPPSVSSAWVSALEGGALESALGGVAGRGKTRWTELPKGTEARVG